MTLEDKYGHLDLEKQTNQYKVYHDNDSDQMAFEINKENPDPDRTFSAEGIEEVISSIRIFIGARIMRHWQDNNKAPHKMQVVVVVAVDPDDN